MQTACLLWTGNGKSWTPLSPAGDNELEYSRWVGVMRLQVVWVLRLELRIALAQYFEHQRLETCGEYAGDFEG